MTNRTYYQILGISRDEGSHALRNAFRELAQRYHPDRVGPAGTPHFQEIVHAYEVLSDPPRRERYDQQLAKQRQAETPGEQSAPVPEPLIPEDPVANRNRPGPERGQQQLVAEPLSLMRDFVAQRPTLDDIFDRIRRNFDEQWRPKSRRLDVLDLRIDISAERARRGGGLVLGIPVFQPCADCRGSGRQGQYSCQPCNESGLLEEERSIRIDIPPGVPDGAIFFVPLRGLGIQNLSLRVLLRIVADH